MRFTGRAELQNGLRVDPRLVLAGRLLQLSQMELEQAIETELNENPALERLNEGEEVISQERILRVVAPQEAGPGSEDREFARSVAQDDSVDWVDLASTTTSLADHLRAQMGLMLPAELRALGDYLVDCLNEKGYLRVPIEEVALACNASMEDAEKVLAVMHQCEPAGVGATSVQECLLLQLRDPESLEQRLARAIVKSYLDEFANRRTVKLCRKFKVMPEVVEAAFEEILALNPFPGEAFQSAPAALMSSRASGVVADLVFERTDFGWSVEVRGCDPTNLTISRAYRKRFTQLQSSNAEKDEKRHVSAFVQRATDFIGCLQQRKRTLRRIGEYLVQNQTSFIATGSYQFLQPMTRAQIAKDIGTHESTVSRATADKYAQLANGEIVSFDVFFKPALRVQKMIEEILINENPSNPLSDERIAQMLADQGIKIARRTVNKYRDRTRLLSSHRRRSA